MTQCNFFQSPKIKNYAAQRIFNRLGNLKREPNFQNLYPNDLNPNFVKNCEKWAARILFLKTKSKTIRFVSKTYHITVFYYILILCLKFLPLCGDFLIVLGYDFAFRVWTKFDIKCLRKYLDCLPLLYKSCSIWGKSLIIKVSRTQWKQKMKVLIASNLR